MFLGSVDIHNRRFSCKWLMVYCRMGRLLRSNKGVKYFTNPEAMKKGVVDLCKVEIPTY